MGSQVDQSVEARRLCRGSMDLVTTAEAAGPVLAATLDVLPGTMR